MSDKINKPDEIADKVHVKKHDHSVLGKHTKKDKKKYLAEQNSNSDEVKESEKKKIKKTHEKKHDHSILGKHTKKDKLMYLEGLKKETPATND
jgi:hypothetical protein